MKGKLRYGNTIIPYSIIQTKRKKTMQIFIEKDKVEVIAPESKKISEIKDILKNRVSWIFNSQLKLKEIKTDVIYSENSLLYLGKNILYTIKILQKNEKIIMKNKEFQIFTKSKSLSITRIKKMYDTWLLAKYLSYVEKKIKHFSKLLNVNPTGYQIRIMKSKWGSATVSDNIHLNLHLLKAPRKMIDYVILHELAHLRIKGHGHDFWVYLEKFMPDYEKRKNWLDQNQVEIIQN
ncbi:M48 family metallopeptidase [Marine Group I thaumarchaeote]|uniref:M48 family metallopeptidase n=1 Tax=Marine Group I thaumarchaeote TaxID=2511932 RepID=A0A7K4MTZ9_9ARCH|nr:M48 family metallopeptidase [Marine Group I thaumarchaeote]